MGGEADEDTMTNHPNRNKARSKYPPSLARSWLESQQSTPGQTKAEVLRKLNEDLGTSHQQGRLYEWLTLEREPDRDARAYMLRECIGYVLEHNGVKAGALSPAQLRAIAEALN
jgi:hypothetical protein